MRTAGGQTTGVLLCGGSGHELDGSERPLLPTPQGRVVDRVLERLQPQVQNVVVACNRHRPEYAALGTPTVTDAPTDHGPLAGVMAAVYAAGTPWVFACPGNAPHLPRNLVRLLYLAARRSPAGMAVPHDGQHLQPLYMLFHRSRGRELRDYLDQGGSNICGFVESMQPAVLDAASIPEAFRVVRTPEDAASLAVSAPQAPLPTTGPAKVSSVPGASLPSSS